MADSDVLHIRDLNVNATTMTTLAPQGTTVTVPSECGQENFDAATGYLATTLVAAPMALFGFIGNVIVAVLFTRSGMRSTPTSVFFTTLAVCDSVTIACSMIYLSLKAYEERLYANGLDISGPGIVIVEISVLDTLQFTIIWGTWTITAILFFRFDVVSKPNLAAHAWRMPRSKGAVLIVTGISLALGLPAVLRFEPNNKALNDADRNTTGHDTLDGYRLARSDFPNYVAYKISYSYFIYYAFAHLLPLCLQAYLSFRLVKSLRRATYPLRCSSLGSIVASGRDGVSVRRERNRIKQVVPATAVAAFLQRLLVSYYG